MLEAQRAYGTDVAKGSRVSTEQKRRPDSYCASVMPRGHNSSQTTKARVTTLTVVTAARSQGSSGAGSGPANRRPAGAQVPLGVVGGIACPGGVDVPRVGVWGGPPPLFR